MEIPCEVCKKAFTPKQKFCSPTCRLIHFRNGHVSLENDNVAINETMSLQWEDVTISDNVLPTVTSKPKVHIEGGMKIVPLDEGFIE